MPLPQIFQANPDKLPAYVGATNERGDFSIYKVLSVTTPGDHRQVQGRCRVGAPVASRSGARC